jgi:hypothetical protein
MSVKCIHPHTEPRPAEQERKGAIAMARSHDTGHGWRHDDAMALPNFDRKNAWRQGKDALLRVPSRWK